MKDLEKWMDRKEIFAIRGPRQAGKTTLMFILREHLLKKKIPEKNIVFLRCDDFDISEPFTKDPKEFIKSHLSNEERHYFFMDEYQYIADGGKKLKLLYDSFPNIKFIISGSSSLELKDKTAKYLVGRVFYFTIYPFSFGEFIKSRDERLSNIYEEKNRGVIDLILRGDDFAVKEDIFLREISKLFEEYVVFGGYPEVIKTNDTETKKMILKNIYDTYINKEIIELLKINSVDTFRTVVNLLASQHSNLLNFDSIASDSKSYFKEIKRFLSVLEETYVLNLLSPYHKNFSTELKKNPKIYFLDLGLRNYIVKNFNIIDLREDRGKLAEGFVFAELNNLLQDKIEIKYWRTLAKAEVDFILVGEEVLPVEVKYSSFKKPNIDRSLRNFINRYKPRRAIVVTKDYIESFKIENTTIKFIPICYF
ncbi:ATP-binding protein [Candidatus Pacearchaeota archaeon]|nr:ATP-binding protein [Candidatus Pacearchaeota archaeon]